jgi:four helix bundle protein
MTIDTSQDIRDRTFRFGCDVARLSLALAPQPGVRCIIDQLLKAGTSIGANLEEAKAASSKREFVRFVEISLREGREAVYWIRVCAALQLGPEDELTRLRAEGDQISRILAAIAISTKRRMIAGHALFAFCILNFALFFSS